jgi:phospholipase C
VDVRRSHDPENDFGQTGFRVPAVVASPYSRRTAVHHVQSDHTSAPPWILP